MCKRRELASTGVRWDEPSRAVRGSRQTSFKDLYSVVHHGDTHELEFDFDALSDQEKEHLIMRAAPLSVAMKDFSAQLGSSAAGAAEFRLSKPARACDDFLSHAWSTRRLEKWYALAYTYNFNASVVAWLVAHLVGVVVCAALAPADRATIGRDYRLQCFVGAVLCPIVAQGAVLVYGLPGLTEPSVFLDKVCINQNHAGLKTLGIEGLETFLKYSRRMVLLYEPGTYKRLWCAFESALFSRYADVRNFVLVPCATARVAIVLTAVSHASVIFAIGALLAVVDARGWDPAEWFRGAESIDHFTLWGQVMGPVMAPLYAVMAWLLRNRCRDILSIERSLRTFRLQDTECFDPNDRTLVESRIVEMWGQKARFDDFVQSTLAQQMAGTIGAADLAPWSVSLAFCLPWLALFTYPGLVQTAAKLSPWRFMASSLCSVGVVWPVAIMFWNFFAFKLYTEFEVKRGQPRTTIMLITIWSIVNCLFTACADREIAHVISERPVAQCVVLLAAYYGACLGITHYFLNVQTRAVKGEMTWAAWAVMASFWVAMGLTFSTRPAAIGCEHATCIWPHPPLK